MSDPRIQEILDRLRNRFFGKYRGTVTDVDAPTMSVKAQVPAVLGNQVSGWCSPCVTVQWVSGAARVTAGGAAALTAASVGLCIAATGAPQGTALVAATQTAASGQ